MQLKWVLPYTVFVFIVHYMKSSWNIWILIQQEGDYVHPGQEICVVEAMKMQNVLKSSRKGIIKSCKAAVGAALKADEIVVEYEKAVIDPCNK